MIFKLVHRVPRSKVIRNLCRMPYSRYSTPKKTILKRRKMTRFPVKALQDLRRLYPKIKPRSYRGKSKRLAENLIVKGRSGISDWLKISHR